MTVHETLVAARNLLDREGWVQRKWVSEDGRCAFGALDGAGAVAGGNFNAAADALIRALDGGRVIEFNNAPGRTKQEVLDLFDRAIASTAPHPADPFVGERMAEGAVS